MVRDFRYAVRGLLGMRAIAAVAILTLAIGIGATTTMFSVVHAALLRPLPFAEPDRLAVLFTTRRTPAEGLQRLRWSWPTITALQASARSFDAIASFTSSLVAISGRGDPEQIDAEVVSSAYFRALRVSPAAGRLFGAADDDLASAQPVALISSRLWKRRFGADRSALADTIRVNDVPLAVAGILPDGFAGLSGKAELWISPPMAARLTYAGYLTSPQNFISVVARLNDGVELPGANAELATLAARLPADSSRPAGEWSAVAVPLNETRVDPTVRRSGFILLGAAACVLLIACVNVASLLLARARARQREMAVRLAIGASRASLVRQLLAEGLVIATLAGTAGTIVSIWGMNAFARAAPEIIPTGRNNYASIGTFGQPALDVTVLAFALLLSLATVLVFALAPALRASRPQLTTMLKEDARGGGPRRRLQSLIVIGDVAIASFLLVGSGLLIESFARIQTLRAGFVSDNVLTFWVRPPSSRVNYPDDGPKIIQQLLARIQSAPGVESAAANRCTPLMGCSRSVVYFPDKPELAATPPGVGRHYASPDYFRTLGIPLITGRLLTDQDRAGTPPVAVVNESGAKLFWPGESPIGKRVWFGTTTGPFSDRARAVEIVGVVGDVRYETIDQPSAAPRADFYTSYLQFAYPDTMFIVKTRGPSTSIVPAMREAVASVDAGLPIYDVMTLDDRLDKIVARPRFNAALLGAFGAVALLLASIGVYGVLSYSVSLRLREIGVRLALGAETRRVFTLVVWDGLRLAALGTAIGLAGAFAAGSLIQTLVTGVSAADPRVFAIAAGIMLAVAALASAIPARRASGVDPVVVLRQD
jgi:predicted permease